MANDIRSILNTQMANGGKSPRPKPQAERVDELASRLVSTYANPQSRRWYCGVIYKFGIDRVEIWLSCSKEARVPGALFTHYVNEAGGYRKNDAGS